ncbi:hypothetical protein ACI7YT_17935 [Microbacterium sp. M]|uniref:hypothetical protein n=1 Tax=Microbacterium sp. M TaxID=3377125 RepID=UPI00386D0E76
MRTRRGTILAVALTALALTGCAENEPAPEETTMMTWEEAKAATQARELEIAALVPDDDVVNIDQNAKGGLFTCDETQHRWKGITTVRLVPGADAEALTKDMEEQVATLFPEGDFEVSNRRGITDKYVATVESPTTGEGYLFGEGQPETIVIDSYSVCFTLPAGTYPGGDF